MALHEIKKERAWDKQERESDQFFAMFEVYLKERSIPTVIKLLYPEGGLTESDYVNKISQRYLWKKRADAFDRWVAKQRDDAIKGLVQHEVKLIAGYRVELIKDLYKKVQRYGRQLDKIFVDEKDAEIYQQPSDTAKGRSKTLERVHLGLVKGYAEMVKITDDLMSGFQKDNPADMSADAPLNAEKQSAAARLAAFVEKNEAALKLESDKLNAQSEIRQ